MSNFLDTAIDIALEAGKILMAHRGVGFELKAAHDLVTAADRASEQFIVKRLREEFPTHGIVAEEGARAELEAPMRWYVDPLDGTTNFAHGYPMWNVTLGLAKNNEMIAGVVYDPTNRELFTAERGAGARLNGAPIHVSKASRIEDSLYSTGFPSRKRHNNVNIHFYYQLAMLSHGVRRGGSAAIDLAYTACGRLEGFWEFGLSPWDMAAGSLLVEEAGGTVAGMQGEAYDVQGKYVLASNGIIQKETLDLFAEIFAGRFPQAMPTLPAKDWQETGQETGMINE
jgi:myo-inositol-1(or 4)-monophosphatase